VNVAQVMRQALLEANAVLQSGITTPLITLAELTTWCQQAIWEIEKDYRAAKVDHGLVIRNSNDSTFIWEDESYNPESFALVAGTSQYTLPPDCLVIRSIRDFSGTSNTYKRRFEHLDISHPLFRALQNMTSPPTDTIFYDFIGDRTLIVANPLDLEIEISYIPRSRRIRLYSTGTVTATLSSTTVEGQSSPNWILQRLNLPMELMIAPGSVAPKVVSQTSSDPFVDPMGETIRAYPVASFTDLDTLELKAPFPLATVTNKAYLLASAPQLLSDHSNIAIRYIVHKIWNKIGHPQRDSEYRLLNEERKTMRQDIGERISEPEFVQDFDI
jgi:hypothetical protein